jgi:hypothetical protein
VLAAVIIGVDPHKGSHTAVAIGAAEEPLGQVRVRASAAQAQRLLAWAAGWPQRTWAVEGAAGLGHLLAQQLVAAGERVLDVQPKLGARVRLLASGDRHLKADAARAAAGRGPGGHPGNDSVASAAGSYPVHRLFGQATPGPAPTLRSRPHDSAKKAASRTTKKTGRTP